MRDAVLRLELPEPGLREDDLLLDRGEVVPEVGLLLLEVGKLVADDVEGRPARQERARRRVKEALLGEVELLFLRDNLGMVLGIGDEQALVRAGGVLEGAVLLGDLLCARHARGEVAERLGVLLHLGQELLPFDELRLLGLERKDVGRGLGEALLDGVARGAQVVHLVGGAEVEELLRDLVDVAALLLDVLVRLADGLVAADLVLFVGVRLDGLRIGVGERRRELRGLGPHRYRDDAGVALKLELRVGERRHDVVVGDGRRGVARPVLLLNHQHDLLGAPVGDSRVEYLGVVGAEVRQRFVERA